MNITVTITQDEYNAIKFAAATCGDQGLYPEMEMELLAMSGLYRMFKIAEPDETIFTELYANIVDNAKNQYPNLPMAPR